MSIESFYEVIDLLDAKKKQTKEEVNMFNTLLNILISVGIFAVRLVLFSTYLLEE